MMCSGFHALAGVLNELINGHNKLMFICKKVLYIHTLSPLTYNEITSNGQKFST